MRLKDRWAWPNTPGEMDLGLNIAASGMLAAQRSQDQLSNNLANASTPGYKPDLSSHESFGEALLASAQGGSPAGQVVEGVGLTHSFLDMAPGPMRDTGQPLDYAIQGPGFFAVRTAQGVRYTRDGQFTVSAQGLLTDAAGNPVLDQRGATIRVPAGSGGASGAGGGGGPGGGGAANGGGGVAASALGVFEVPGAVKQGGNLYAGVSTGRSQSAVREGVLEGSSVDAAKTLVDMIASLRSFQSGQQAVQTIGQTLQQAASQVGAINVGG